MSRRLFFALIGLAVALAPASAKARADYEELFASNDYARIRKELVRNGDLVYEKAGANAQTLLMYVLEAGADSDTVEMVLSASPKIDEAAKDGRTVVMFAAENCSDAKLFEKILRADSLFPWTRKKRLVVKDKAGHTAFHYAKAAHNREVYELMLEYTDDPDAESEPFREEAPAAKPSLPPPTPPESRPAGSGRVRADFDFYGSREPSREADDREKEGGSAPESADDGDDSYVFVPNANKPDSSGNYPLMSAARNSDVALMRNLIQSGASVNALDKADRTALMFAAQYAADPRACLLLINNRAAVKSKDTSGNTALDLAVRHNPNAEVTRLLLRQYIANTSSTTKSFFLAIESRTNPAEKVAAFLAMGQSATTPRDGVTPLCHAAQKASDIGVLRALIGAGASLRTRDSQGKTAESYARANSFLDQAEVSALFGGR